VSWFGSDFFRGLRNRALIGATGVGVRTLFLTMRFRVEGWEAARKQLEQTGGILVLWHNVVMIPLAHSCRREMRALISVGRDGEFAARVMRGFGVEPIRGSTSRAGARALREAVARARTTRGMRLGLTPDGPRGPRYRFQIGAVWLAAATGLPVIPLGVEVSRAWHLRSWDRHRIPKPFSRAHMVFGDPVFVPDGLNRDDLESERCRMEAALCEASQDAARRAGVTWPDRATS